MSQINASPLIDSRWVFWTYILLAGLTGVYLFAWGPSHFRVVINGELWAGASLIRLVGGILATVAVMTIPTARIRDTEMRQAALGWYALAHALVAWVLYSQQTTVASSFTPEWTVDFFLGIAAVFFYIWLLRDGRGRVPRPLTTLFGDNAFGENAEPALPLRSQYEEQIRLAAAQEERHRLARDLHDSVKQQLFVIQTSAATAQERMTGDQEGAVEAVRQVRIASREALAEMQAMLDQLQAEPLENSGLIEAIKQQCEAFGFRTGAKVEVDLGELPASEDLQPGVHETMLRVVQEALSNAARHARPAVVRVSLRMGHNKVTLSVQDDGAGFEPLTVAPGMGLQNMRRRAGEAGGSLEILSAAGTGTVVRFEVPYRSRKKLYYGPLALTYGFCILLLMGTMIFRHKYNMLWFQAFIGANFVANLSGWLRERREKK